MLGLSCLHRVGGSRCHGLDMTWQYSSENRVAFGVVRRRDRRGKKNKKRERKTKSKIKNQHSLGISNHKLLWERGSSKPC